MFRWLLRNLQTLALAFVLATAVWVSAVTAADPDEVRVYPRPIPLEIVGQDPGLVILGPVPASISLTLRAPRSVWDKLSSTEDAVRAVMDLSSLSAGQHTVSIQIQIQMRPVRVVSSFPATVSMSLESLATKTFSINLAIFLVKEERSRAFLKGASLGFPSQSLKSGGKAMVEGGFMS